MTSDYIAAIFVFYTHTGSFILLARPSRVFNDNSRVPFMTTLS